MSVLWQDKFGEQNELVGRLCNENLDTESRARLNDALAGDAEAQQEYVRYMDLQAMIRLHAQSLDDENFALREAQAALDAAQASESTAEIGCSRRARAMPLSSSLGKLGQSATRPVVWGTAAAALLMAITWAWLTDTDGPLVASVSNRTTVGEATDGGQTATVAAQLRGTVGARWAGDRLELLEGEKFHPGRRLELVEGLAEVYFNCGARVILQGPAIIGVRDSGHAVVSVGRVAVSVTEDSEAFCVETAAARLAADMAEYGVEVEVDGSLATEVYDGEVSLRFGAAAKNASTLILVRNQAAEVDAQTGNAAMIPEPTGLHFVRYLPRRDTRINLAEVVAGGGATAKAYHRGISLSNGEAINEYGAPVVGDGKYTVARGVEFVDGVFIPNGRFGQTQVDSIGRAFAGFPETAGDCWGGVIMARRPRYESSLPLIQLEFFGENYGYVNWLHIASDSDELSPVGLGLIGMHSNCGITFDLHAMRARYPDRTITRFRALVGNLESKAELPGDRHTAEAWVLVDGKLRHHRTGFSRESGPESIEIPLSDRDRFLVLAVTDDGGSTAYDWVAFGDAVVEMEERDRITSNVREQEPQSGDIRLARLR